MQLIVFSLNNQISVIANVDNGIKSP